MGVAGNARALPRSVAFLWRSCRFLRRRVAAHLLPDDLPDRPIRSRSPAADIRRGLPQVIGVRMRRQIQSRSGPAGHGLPQCRRFSNRPSSSRTCQEGHLRRLTLPWQQECVLKVND
jgi:hypothetical protein